MTTAFNQPNGGESPGQDKGFDMAAAVTEFHRAFNLRMRQLPSAEVDDALARLRVALLEEVKLVE